ncbi:unnamed protein product [Mycena citricolor]|uniref:ribonuclease H n=1 Tax=Mycena citricolor TaxID=2018698 RepID=A0AAD2GU87_9AGAR|nr:unnamed protein product [Mycena citricolor]
MILHANSRNYRCLHEPWGGVLTYIANGLGAHVRDDLCSPDITVVELDDLFLVNAYILPHQSSRDGWTNADPWDKFEETMAALQASGKAVIAMGDLNARTGNAGGAPTSVRSSPDKDKPITPQGHSLLRLCSDIGLEILNGNTALGTQNAAYTSFQPQGNSVIDYGLANQTALPNIRLFNVLPPDLAISDHAAIRLEYICYTSTLSTSSQQPIPCLPPRKPPRTRKEKTRDEVLAQLPTDTSLDRLFVDVLRSRLTNEQKLAKLLGDTVVSSAPRHVYVDGACKGNGTERAAAGSGIYWGPGNLRNTACRTPGEQTNNRAEIYAIYRALLAAHPMKTLHIFSDSVYAMEGIAVRSPENASLSWKCTNGDIFRDVIALIRARPAPVVLIQVKGHSGNGGNDAADSLAQMGSGEPVATEHTHTWPPAFGAIGTVMPYPNTSEPSPSPKLQYLPLPPKPAALAVCTDHTPSLNVHRGRVELRRKQLEQQMMIVEASTEAEMWRATKKIMNPAPMSSGFSAGDLKAVFEVRMNPISPIPPTFDAERLKIDQELANTIADKTRDTTEDRIFDSPFTVEDMAEAKLRLKEHPPTSAKGYDEQTYADVCALENNQLCNLVNCCISETDAPSVWLRTMLIGIPKGGKPKSDPNSYRTIGLESCFLKLTTLLIHMRLSKWCKSRGLLPASQNAFREGFRTNDNMFILRCAIERARHQNRPLYVVFADLSNAFPSTEQSTLWLKMRKAGAGGAIFDFLRMLYRRMVYIVRHENEMSDVFHALLGILIGDTSSPILWIIYLSDFRTVSDATMDILLAGVFITNLEQADDVALLSMTPMGIQRKMAALWKWCRTNFMILNAIKSYATPGTSNYYVKWLRGPLRRPSNHPLPPLIGGHPGGAFLIGTLPGHLSTTCMVC